MLLKRDFAPAATRLKSVTARLQGIPALYAAGKANVKTPPKEWTDLAIIMGNGTLGYLQDTVGPWAKEAAGTDAVAYAEFNRANTTAIAATQDYLHHLEKELLPQEQRKLGHRRRGVLPEAALRGDDLRSASRAAGQGRGAAQGRRAGLRGDGSADRPEEDARRR